MKEKHLWVGDGRDGKDYFWATETFEPKHRDYAHSDHCPCKTGVEPVWEFNEEGKCTPYGSTDYR